MQKEILFTFLGKGRSNLKTGYQPAKYAFADGKQIETVFFGFGLAEYLQVDEVVVLGTSGSQWSILLENFGLIDDCQDFHFKLLEAEESSTVGQQLVDETVAIVNRTAERKVSARIIPQGNSKVDQYEILKQIAYAKPEGSASVSIDVTHGFRHLAMIGFLSVFVLERLGRGKIEVGGVWYGAFDMMKDNIVPVIKLDGLVQVQKWVEALRLFDETGNYAVMSELLKEDDVDERSVALLEESAFHEYTNNTLAAQKKLEQIRSNLKNKTFGGASGLFQSTLSDRLDWIRQPNLGQRQKQLAEQFLQRRDYLRAAIFGWEAYITKCCEDKGFDAISDRRECAAELDEYVKQEYSSHCSEYKAFFGLRELRNILAHSGQTEKQEVQKALKSQENLAAALREWFDALLG